MQSDNPAERWSAQFLATRALLLACLIVASVWVFGSLGGLRLSPAPTGEPGQNDTAQLFNWHPLLMTLAFPVLMGEALLSYKAALLNLRDRSQRKVWHAALQTSVLVCMVLAVTAAVCSHNLKRPAPIPNLYSAHSWLGCLVIVLFGLQYVAGAAAYLLPWIPLAKRQALSPQHKFFGKAVFLIGLATMATGIQEKATFSQAFQKVGMFSAVMKLPAVLCVLLALTGAAVLWHHSEAAQPPPARRLVRIDETTLTERSSTEQEPLRVVRS